MSDGGHRRRTPMSQDGGAATGRFHPINKQTI